VLQKTFKWVKSRTQVNKREKYFNCYNLKYDYLFVYNAFNERFVKVIIKLLPTRCIINKQATLTKRTFKSFIVVIICIIVKQHIRILAAEGLVNNRSFSGVRGHYLFCVHDGLHEFFQHKLKSIRRNTASFFLPSGIPRSYTISCQDTWIKC